MSGLSIEFDHVSKWYRQVSALIEVSFSLSPGVTGLVGQNGAGKSTLLKIVSGLLRPSLGEIRVCGESPRSAAVHRQLGYCPDLDKFYERLSGRRFVAWMLRYSGYSRADAHRRSGEVLERLGLGEAMHRRISTYSKGMRQRVKLAQALAHDPRVIILDEPLTGLDPVARHEIADLVRDLGRSGALVLVSSHVLQELQNVADRFLLLHQGRLMAEGELRELREQLEDRPRKITLRSRDPRALAVELCAIPQVGAVRIDQGAVSIDVRGPGVFDRLTEIGAQDSGLVDELMVLDDSLEAVFGYLVS